MGSLSAAPSVPLCHQRKGALVFSAMPVQSRVCSKGRGRESTSRLPSQGTAACSQSADGTRTEPAWSFWSYSVGHR